MVSTAFAQFQSTSPFKFSIDIFLRKQYIFSVHLTDVQSFQEKLVHGLLISAGVLAYPVYAMYEVAAVKREEYAAMEVPEEWQAWKERQNK